MGAAQYQQLDAGLRAHGRVPCHIGTTSVPTSAYPSVRPLRSSRSFSRTADFLITAIGPPCVLFGADGPLHVDSPCVRVVSKPSSNLADLVGCGLLACDKAIIHTGALRVSHDELILTQSQSSVARNDVLAWHSASTGASQS